MILEEALGVEDDYVRLQKIAEGIKQISQSLKTQKNFNSPSLIKQLICSYPFSDVTIEMLLNECFEQHKSDPKFIMAFHKALQEVAILQEFRQFLGTRSLFNKQNRQLSHNNNITSILREQLKQGSIPFSREVIERLIIAKRFSVKFIIPIFTLSKEYKFDLEQMASIFKLFLMHTKNEEFQLQIIDIYEELKLSIFKDLEWIEEHNQELEDYFIQNKIKVPQKLIQSKLMHIKNKNKKLLHQHFIKKCNMKSETESDSLSVSPEQPKLIDYKTKIQQWLCMKDTPIIDLDNYVYFTNSENLNSLLSFILNPCKIDLIADWELTFTDIEATFKKKHFKNLPIKLDKLQIIRSYKTVLLFQNQNNIRQIDKLLTTFVEISFRKIYDSLINDEINLNINHLVNFIQQLILLNPQKSAYQILEYNLLFTFSLYIYNHQMTTFIGDMLSLWIDKFKFGFYLQEQIWKYLDYTNWFNFFFQILLKQPQRNEQCYQEYKTLKIDGILAFVKLLKQPEKTQQTQNDFQNSVTSRQEPLTPIEFSEEQQILNSSQWMLDNNSTANQIMEDMSQKDIDNLKYFSIEKNKSIMTELQESSPLRIRIMQSSYNKGFYGQSSDITNKAILSPKGKMHHSSVSLPSIDNKAHKSESVDSQNCQNYASRQRNKTYIISQDGFSTTKLISIYPRRNIDLQFTHFETAQSFFIYNKHTLKGCTRVFKILNDSIFNSLYYQENLVKDSFQKQQFLNLAQRNFINERTIITLFQIYLYGIFDEESKVLQKSSIECGLIINEIYKNSLTFQEKSLNNLLKSCFGQVADFVSKKLIELNNFTQIPDFKFKQFLLFSTLVNGLQYFDLYDPNRDERNIYKYLNETVMHILIIWFFNSHQNNIFQQNFVRLIAILFSRAPQYQLQNLLFHVGLLTSLFNGYNTYNRNGCKNIDYVESLYMNIMYLIYIINANVYSRQLTQLISNLESSASWKGIQQTICEVQTNYLNQLNQLMKLDRSYSVKKIKSSQKILLQPNSKDSIRPRNDSKNDNSQLNELLKQKSVTKESSPVKQQMQIKKLIRYRTKNSIKA
ncbi:unnamed protein product [Paramecium octaurelia]|uniref:Uncharacterized protein n=1 Tax=Paramecium octaurelia TaxID=43137 RepID=A0A8S1TSK2_PAROT|nr:unnamed protein product [Paramecium octaurelia]